jgi:hypothetical protein
MDRRRYRAHNGLSNPTDFVDPRAVFAQGKESAQRGHKQQQKGQGRGSSNMELHWECSTLARRDNVSFSRAAFSERQLSKRRSQALVLDLACTRLF